MKKKVETPKSAADIYFTIQILVDCGRDFGFFFVDLTDIGVLGVKATERDA